MENTKSNIRYINVGSTKLNMSYYDSSYYLYNEKNDRMLEVQEDPTIFLKSYTGGNNALDTLLSKKKKWVQIPDFRIIQCSFRAFPLDPLFKFLNIIQTKWVLLSCTLLQLFFFLPFVKKNIAFLNMINGMHEKTFQYAITLFISALVVGITHELGHYAVYQRKFEQERLFWGISLRYFAMVVFFSSVPLIFEMTKKEQRKLIAAGIKIQLQLSFLIMILGYFSPSFFLVVCWLTNIVILILNLLPFVKLDGFWLINSFLGVQSYTSVFWKKLKRKEKIPLAIFSLTICNYACILFVILSLLYTIFSGLGDLF